MSSQRVTVLVVDDHEPMRRMIATTLRAASDFDVIEAESVAAAQQVLAGDAPVDLVLTDVRMPSGSGLELATHARAMRPGLPVIVMTGSGDLDMAIEAMRSGACDFLQKPFDLVELTTRIRHAVARSSHSESGHTRPPRPEGVDFESMLGASAVMRELFDVIENVAGSPASVMIFGETGTGKELVARALHARSRRASGPFVAVNCAAVTETLLEAELFGHVQGGFTDAHGSRRGLFVAASGGTIFLDEIAEMAPALQSKMLRALEQRTVRPVGSDHEIAFDARVLSATHRDLDARIADGLFREDLFYRLDVIELRVPPLRARGDDLLILAREFARRCAERNGRRPVRLGPACERCLADYPWPGNVRELANVMERAVTLARGSTIDVVDLPDKIARPSPPSSAAIPESHGTLTALTVLSEVERRHVLAVLAACDGHRGRAAEVLGIDRKTLYAKLKQYGLPSRNERPASR